MIFDSDRFGASIGIVATSFFGALNDNLIKTALIVFAAMTVPAEQAATVGLLAGGLLVLPFILFSGWAGLFADKFEKAKTIRILKLSELCLACAATAAMMSGSIPAMLGIVFLMGVQSAAYGPVKLGWLPERLHATSLVGANAWLESFTFLGILGGTVIGGLLAGPQILVWAGVASIAVGLLGAVVSFALPVGQAAAPDTRIPWFPLAGVKPALAALFADKPARNAALMAAWFWAAGSVFLSTLPAQLRSLLDVDHTIVALVMGLFAVGIGSGAFAAARILGARASARLALPGAVLIAISVFGVVRAFDGLAVMPVPELTSTTGIALMLSLFGLAAAGGLFAVPLKAVIQARSQAATRGQTMAGFGIVSSVAIVAASVAVAIAIATGVTLGAVYTAVGISALAIGVLTVLAFPRDTLHMLGGFVFRRLLRVRIEGEEHLRQDGPVVFVANHVSFADGPLLFSIIDREMKIAVNTEWATTGILGALRKPLGIYPVDPQNPMAAKSLAQEVQGGGAALIFPEGRISTSSALMKTYPGTAWLVDLAEAPVVAINIEGLEASIFNRPIANLRRRLFPKVTVRVSPPEHLNLDPALTGAARRKAATARVSDIMERARFTALNSADSVPALWEASRQHFASSTIAVEDATGVRFTGKRVSIGAAVFSKLLQDRTDPSERIGVLLPSVAGATVALLGIWRAGRVAAILNPTLGPAPMMSAIQTGQIKRILTSQAFVEKAEIGPLIEHLERSGIEILWTDALKESVTAFDKLRAIIASRKATDVPVRSQDPAAVLFTSGTEGAPKGVVLTHGNLVANVAQVRARTDINPRDRILSAMPLFHSFGLTGGMLVPLMSGAPLMLYPSPLHYKVIPELAYQHQATVIFGTDTFLNGWAKQADAYDFASLRCAIAGAEAVKPATRALWAQKFGVRILEGYGATEASPILAVNTPMDNRPGTVGRPMMDLQTRLEPVQGVDGKRLFIKGPNVMAGYLMPGGNGALVPPPGGWYDTGDIVEVDTAGFITIVGRAKRFAKVGGEMVSLAACESLAADVWPETAVAAVSIQDPKKGERVLLCTTAPGATRANISAAAKAQGIKEILVPAEVRVMETIPLLASGKVDYPALSRLLEAEIQPEAEPCLA